MRTSRHPAAWSWGWSWGVGVEVGQGAHARCESAQYLHARVRRGQSGRCVVMPGLLCVHARVRPQRETVPVPGASECVHDNADNTESCLPLLLFFSARTRASSPAGSQDPGCRRRPACPCAYGRAGPARKGGRRSGGGCEPGAGERSGAHGLSIASRLLRVHLSGAFCLLLFAVAARAALRGRNEDIERRLLPRSWKMRKNTGRGPGAGTTADAAGVQEPDCSSGFPYEPRAHSRPSLPHVCTDARQLGGSRVHAEVSE